MSGEHIPPPDHEAIERERWKQNRDEVASELRNQAPRLVQRITTFVSRFNYQQEDVLEKIGNDEIEGLLTLNS